MTNKNLTILFSDIVGFTSLASSCSRNELLYLLQLHEQIVIPVVEKYEGKVIKSLGDAFLVVFDSPTNAVLCGIKIQEAVGLHNAYLAETEQLKLRIAVSCGEVTVRGDDVFGTPVNIASRLQSLAQPGEVYLTESVLLVINRNEIPTVEVGKKQLKGISEEIKVFKAEWAYPASYNLRSLVKRPDVKVRPLHAGLAFATLAIIGFILMAKPKGPAPDTSVLAEDQKIPEATEEVLSEEVFVEASQVEWTTEVVPTSQTFLAEVPQSPSQAVSEPTPSPVVEDQNPSVTHSQRDKARGKKN